MEIFSAFVMCLIGGYAISYPAAFFFTWATDQSGRAEGADAVKAYRLTAIGLLVLAGPFLLARQAIAAQTDRAWPESHLTATYALSGLWSVIIGFGVAQLLIG
ncbi:MAG TPA: hypothetical protein DCL48_10265 [Alphaproteobacteria bacterium]|nr:hypothetical protein [Alphaproteobacteria bacterium]